MNFYIYSPGFKEHVGGIMVLHNLAKDLIDLGHNVKMYIENMENNKNNFCNNFITTSDIIDTENYITIYPEIIKYNPLNTKKVIRWILCELGIFDGNKDIYNTWSKNDLVYYYSSYRPDNRKNLKYMFSLYINPIFKNINNNERNGTLFLMKKATLFHKNIKYIHEPDAIQISPSWTQNDMMRIFNHAKYIIIYDPYTYIMCMASMCGCIPIIYPMENVSKKEWTDSLFCIDYLKSINKDYMYGIAYGLDDINYAISTIDKVVEEQNKLSEYGKKTVSNMINDITTEKFLTVNDIYFKLDNITN
jgi:hypothetical protein